ncbi:MAG: DUF1963 domain-containing protein [Lachnospiraceae bacterium]|nr:DUF1963 domain-containing protein [Lachnospiraceae bacterium]
MEDKKFLKVIGKRVDENGTVAAEAAAVLPYARGGSGELPNVPPFNTNVWLDGDTGYNMTSIEFPMNGKIGYFYNKYYDFVDGKIHAECEINGDTMIFDFELINLAKNADYAIAMKVRKVQPGEKIDESCSKFFGMPCLPECIQDPYPDDGVFFAQIRCEDIKDLDDECRLPHEGYLYFFLDAEMYPSDQLYMMVDYSLEEPKYVIEDYNEACNIKGLTDTYMITFEKADAGYNGTKLLGYPSNDVDDSDDRTGLLLQYDPQEFDVPFLATLDGYAFVFFGEDEKNKFNGVDYIVWGS